MAISARCAALVFVLALWSCAPEPQVPEQNEVERPNILWIYLEDTNPLMGPYGTSVIATPHIDSLAERGSTFTHVFMPSPVCSPTRSSIVTGSMSTTLGLHNHHSSRTEASAIHLPDGYRTVPELFKEAGYLTFNNGKDDYNFDYDRRDLYDQDYSRHPLYGKRGDEVELSSLKGREPFFGQIQLRGGKEIFSNAFSESLQIAVDRDAVELPPYLPDHPAIVEEYADHLDAIQITDRRVGEILRELGENELLANTVVFFFSDHGMRITRHKQFLYDGGLRVPLIVADYRENGVTRPHSQDESLISGLDIGTTSLALAGIPIPDSMEGVDFLAAGFEGRDFVIATRDRCDFTIDRIRSVRSKRFKYIRNFLTDRPLAQKTYMDFDGVEFVRVMRQLVERGDLNDDQARFFAQERTAEELYDLEKDPHELDNLAAKPEYEDIRAEYASILARWIEETGDQGQHLEGAEGLGLMLGIWGDHATNPEYDALRVEQPGLSGSLSALKSSAWTRVAGSGSEAEP